MGDINQAVNVNLKVRDQGLQEALDKLGDSVVELKPETTALQDALARLGEVEVKATAATADFGAALDRLDRELREVKGDEQALALGLRSDVVPALGQAEQAVEKVAKSKRNMAQAALQGSRALQDFVQGGIGGILNNIEGVAAALGSGPGMAGLMTTLGLAAFVAIPAVKSLWAAITGGAEKMPEAADRVGRISAELDKVKDSLEELAKADGLTAAQAEQAVELQERRVKLEKELNDEKARGKALDEAREKKPTAAESALSADMKEILQGPQAEEAIRSLEADLRRRSNDSKAPGQLGDLRGQLRSLLQGQADHDRDDPFNLTGSAGRWKDQIAAMEARIKAQDEGLRRQAEDLVLKARSGDRGAVANVIGGLPAGSLREQLEANTPEAIARHDAEAGAVGDYTPEERARRRAAAARKKKNAEVKALVDESTGWAHELGVDMDRDREKKNAQVDALVDENSTFWSGQDARDAKKEAVDTPGARLRARRDGMYQSAVGIATAENDALPPGMQFNPSQLDSIAREAADTAAGFNPDSIREAVYRGAAAMREKVQRDVDAQMGRMWQGGDSYMDF